MTASLAPLRMADLQHLAIPGQNKVPRKDLRFSRFEHSSPAMLWEWEARQPENWLLRTGRVDVDGQGDAPVCRGRRLRAGDGHVEELLPHTTWTVYTQHGRHYYYLTTEISSQRIMGGLDQKCGRNVYVVAPGSPGYVQSAEWRHGWPPTLTLRQWMVMEQTWRDQRPEPDALPGGHGGTGPGRKRRRHHNQAGSSNWRRKVQRCELHPLWRAGATPIYAASPCPGYSAGDARTAILPPGHGCGTTWMRSTQTGLKTTASVSPKCLRS